MARFQHTVTLTPVPRRWFESCVVMLHDLAESLEEDGARLRLPDGRHLPELFLDKGRHLQRGARYHPESDEEGPDLDAALTVLAWDRRRETALEMVALDDNPHKPTHMVCTLRLTSVERPREAELSGKAQASGGRWTRYTSGSGRLHLDLGAWWPSAAGRGRRTGPPVTGTLDHPLTRATATVVPRPAQDGRWRVTVKVRVTGRSFARLLLPVAMAVFRRRARAAFAEALDEAAEEWNRQVPELVSKDPEQLRLELVESLFKTDEEHQA
ncbi:hypothetical protein [Streptomyces ureilyticus]|uniref:Uncharacterized protein n=1 Tax=Streptomyces ureilyticus TaxID=1775131 RepID=A0ABX0DRY7_9ACTN|nr:hypothetical protein [Streptomyces ureilyticus]NGO43490.1 hypothetical protein [Streptomyces ureilyticus]